MSECAHDPEAQDLVLRALQQEDAHRQKSESPIRVATFPENLTLKGDHREENCPRPPGCVLQLVGTPKVDH
jgi:hypothetical protein